MQPFDTLTALAAPLPEPNIDTDIIVPARFLTITAKRGLGQHAFAEWRARGAFVLDDPAYAGARILVAGRNFGCGSSREQAAWALADLGIRCILAPSFGEIFRANALRNGMLPIVLPEREWHTLLAAAEQRVTVTIDLAARTIAAGTAPPLGFAIADSEREALLNGWDEIEGIRAHHGGAVAAFEAGQRVAAPWLWQTELNDG